MTWCQGVGQAVVEVSPQRTAWVNLYSCVLIKNWKKSISIRFVPFYVMREYKFVYVLCVYIIGQCPQYPSNLIFKFVGHLFVCGTAVVKCFCFSSRCLGTV